MSYCVNCFASRQTIAEGDATVIFPIVRQGAHAPRLSVLHGGVRSTVVGASISVTGIDAFWSMVAAPVRGRYADISTFNLDDTPLNREAACQLLRTLAKQSVVTECGSDDRREPAFELSAFLESSAKPLADLFARPATITQHDLSGDAMWSAIKATWSYVETAADAHRLFVADNGLIVPFELASMHKTAYDTLVDWTLEEVGLVPRAWLDRTLAQAQTSQQETVGALADRNRHHAFATSTSKRSTSPSAWARVAGCRTSTFL